MDIIEAIENCDLSFRNRKLREDTCSEVLKGIDEIQEQHQICKSAREAFQTIKLAEQREEGLSWWNEAFSTYKSLWRAIKDKNAEPELADQSRSASLRFLEAILFSVKITILALITDTECDDCSDESFAQLIALTGFIHRIRRAQRSTEPAH